MSLAMLIFGILTVMSALGVVLAHKPLHSALYLVLTLCLIAAHYALIGAHFIAAAQVLVYAGAIMVLVIFVIMLLGMTKGEVPERPRLRLALPVLTAIMGFLTICLGGIGFFGVRHGYGFTLYPASPESVIGNTEAVGEALYVRFYYPIQIVGLLLLAAVVGAVSLALEARRPLAPGRGLRAKQELKTQLSEQGIQ